jgi:Zn-dependent M16 (insulinase) family peptidase
LFSQRLDDQDYFNKVLNPVETLEVLAQKPAEYWASLIDEIFTDNCVVVIGKPDAKIGEVMAAEEAKRLKELKTSIKADPAKRQRLDENKSGEASVSLNYALS